LVTELTTNPEHRRNPTSRLVPEPDPSLRVQPSSWKDQATDECNEASVATSQLDPSKIFVLDEKFQKGPERNDLVSRSETRFYVLKKEVTGDPRTCIYICIKSYHENILELYLAYRLKDISEYQKLLILPRAVLLCRG
jgi:hypothetical protein